MKNQLFKFENNEVRTVEVDGIPYFVAKDVALVLGYKNTNESISEHCKKQIIGSKTLPLSNEKELKPRGRRQDLILIPESDVYRLIMRSKLPSAEAFSDWVCEEVLPSIRKTGNYTIESAIVELIRKDIYKYGEAYGRCASFTPSIIRTRTGRIADLETVTNIILEMVKNKELICGQSHRARSISHYSIQGNWNER